MSGPVEGCDAPVIVVGAGPVGLCLSLLLGRLGVPTLLLEAGERLGDRAGSRAICIQRDILEILERVGCGRRAVEEGVVVRQGRTYFGARELFTTRLKDDRSSPFPPYISFPQSVLEARLVEVLERGALAGSCEIRWSHRVDAVEQDAHGVRVTATGPDGPVTLRGRYVVGCDGGRSTVRTNAAIAFEGHSHPDCFLIADVRTRLPYAEGERHFFFSPPFNPGRQVLIFPQPNGVWRIDWQVPDALGDAAAERASGRLDERIRSIAGHDDYELVWLSAYRFQHRVARRFRAGRVFLAGDAAHLMAPFGARGMTSGIADAENLAWKLASVLDGDAPESLLDTYEAERRAAARHNLEIVGKSLRFMAPPSRRARLVRDATLWASRLSRRARDRVDGGKLYEPFTYPAKPLRNDAGPLQGALALDAPCELTPARGGGPTRPVRLRELFGRRLFALYLPNGAESAEASAFAERAAASIARGERALVDVHVAVGRRPHTLALPLPSLVDSSGLLAERYASLRGSVVVVRPDGHVAGAVRGGPDEAALGLEDLVRETLAAR